MAVTVASRVLGFSHNTQFFVFWGNTIRNCSNKTSSVISCTVHAVGLSHHNPFS